MKKIITVFLFLGLLCGVSTLHADEAVEGTAVVDKEQWSKASGEVSGAAKAVGDATADTSKKAWTATKEGSAEVVAKTKEESKKAWKKTKEKSKDLWEKGKAKVHEATAPASVKQEGD